MENNLGVDILIQDERWKGIDELEKRVFDTCKAVITLKHPELLEKNLEVSIVLSNNQLLQHLNKEYRKQDKPTNVLSFPAFASVKDILKEMKHNPESVALGDIIVSYDKCRDESIEQGKTLADHLMHLIVHGLLHLLGYDHINDEDAEIMEATEVEILEVLGIANPYNY